MVDLYGSSVLIKIKLLWAVKPAKWPKCPLVSYIGWKPVPPGRLAGDAIWEGDELLLLSGLPRELGNLVSASYLTPHRPLLWPHQRFLPCFSSVLRGFAVVQHQLCGRLQTSPETRYEAPQHCLFSSPNFIPYLVIAGRILLRNCWKSSQQHRPVFFLFFFLRLSLPPVIISEVSIWAPASARERRRSPSLRQAGWDSDIHQANGRPCSACYVVSPFSSVNHLWPLLAGRQLTAPAAYPVLSLVLRPQPSRPPWGLLLFPCSDKWGDTACSQGGKKNFKKI